MTTRHQCIATISKTAALALTVVVLSGCAGLPLAERQANATTEVSEKWSRDQKERLEAVIGAVGQNASGGVVEWTVDSREAGNGDQSLLGGLENSIPGGLKLVYLGVGILVMVFAVRRVAHSSNAVRATLGAADAAIAKQIRKLEGRLQGSQNDKERAELMSLLIDLESERGKLRN